MLDYLAVIPGTWVGSEVVDKQIMMSQVYRRIPRKADQLAADPSARLLATEAAVCGLRPRRCRIRCCW
ncbi:MAG: hypothetical protein IPJ98_28520 [Bryobacterales bacterium]|nr:hypothetical protein [Bryobacterales bacterium]